MHAIHVSQAARVTRTACVHNCRVPDKSNVGLGLKIKDNTKLEEERENHFDPSTRNLTTSMLRCYFYFIFYFFLSFITEEKEFLRLFASYQNKMELL